jgi:hypothetical protein
MSIYVTNARCTCSSTNFCRADKQFMADRLPCTMAGTDSLKRPSRPAPCQGLAAIRLLDEKRAALKGQPRENCEAGRLGDDFQVQCFGLRRRAQAQFLTEDLDALPVLLDGSCAVSLAIVATHQLAVPHLSVRVLVEKALV